MPFHLSYSVAVLAVFWLIVYKEIASISGRDFCKASDKEEIQFLT
jgi:hypothetical protein